jgi:hypothetical protein
MVSHKKYYKREGDGFPQVQVAMSLVNPCMHVVRLCIKNALTMHYPTCCLVCASPYE